MCHYKKGKYSRGAEMAIQIATMRKQDVSPKLIFNNKDLLSVYLLVYKNLKVNLCY